MMEVMKMILFGIVEGITEWLPISSTGHMILLNEIVKLDVSDEFYSEFQVVIQLGAIMAVVILFWNKIWKKAQSASFEEGWNWQVDKDRYLYSLVSHYCSMYSCCYCWSDLG